MTIAVAVRKGTRAVLAADSLVHFGGQRFPTENCQFNKIYPIGETLMVWSGWSLYGEMLDAFLSAQDPKPALATEAEMFAFFVRFWRVIRDEYTFMVQRPQGPGPPFVDLDSIFLLLNRSGIYRVGGDMDVTQFEQYAAIGSGSRYALGALRILYDQHDDPVEIAKRAVQVAIDFDVYCGGRIDIAEMRMDKPRAKRG